MSDFYAILQNARADFEEAKKLAKEGAKLEGVERGESARLYQRAHALYKEAAQIAAHVWRSDGSPSDAREEAARLSSDAIWLSASTLLDAESDGAPDALRAAALLGVELYERDGLPDDARLHGLYRAQCASFELGHLQQERAPETALQLFRDADRCADAALEMDGEEVDHEKVARVLANAASASLNAARLLRDTGSLKYREELDTAIERGQVAVEMDALPGPMQVETTLIVAEALYEMALLSEDKKVVGESLQNALGWARKAAESPQANALMQGEAWHRGANYACVYGLFIRHDDFAQGEAALQGAIGLALEVAQHEVLPMDLRAPSFETAVRTWQNLGILYRERQEAEKAAEAFVRAASLAHEASQTPHMPASFRGGFDYLAANARMELAALRQAAFGDHDPEVGAQLRQARELAERALNNPESPRDIVARAALVGCGAVGRLMRGLRADDAASIRAHLEVIERLGQRAAHTEGADAESRSKGAFFAADAAERLAGYASDERLAQAARQRAAQMRAWSQQLKGQH
jgi:hypothetical protein